jgi:hypothetical protein
VRGVEPVLGCTEEDVGFRTPGRRDEDVARHRGRETGECERGPHPHEREHDAVAASRPPRRDDGEHAAPSRSRDEPLGTDDPK